MARRSELKPGQAISFRIPEDISKPDLEYLRKLDRTKTIGKVGALSQFFFRMIEEARIAEGKTFTIGVPELTIEQVRELSHPLIRQAVKLYLYQLLGQKVDNVSTNVETLNLKESRLDETTQKKAQDDINPDVLNLMNKLKT